MQVVAVVLLHNEDVFAERVVRNVSEFCDQIFVVDHVSTDRTWEIVTRLSEELDNVEARRMSHAARSHELVLPYVGTDTWVMNPDGDELFDPEGLRRLREKLEAGCYDRFFRLFPAMLHCVEIDFETCRASGYLSPPALSGPKLFNFSALASWGDVYRERLHEGSPVFRAGWGWTSVRRFGEEHEWESNPFRCLHACFVRRSSCDPHGSVPYRLNIAEANSYRRDTIGRLKRRLRGEQVSRSSVMKVEKYKRGPLVTKDARAFFAANMNSSATGLPAPSS